MRWIMKSIFSLFKKIVFGFIVLYGYNMIAVNFNLVIPINIVTVGLVSILGFPALFSLTLLYVLVY